MAGNSIITPQYISHELIKQDILEFVKNRPDWTTWKTFIESGPGMTFIEVVAAMGTFNAYHGITNKNEVYLDTAQALSSNIAIAKPLGYSVFRGRNPHVAMNVTLDSSVVFNAYDIIGSCGQYDIICLERTVVNSKVPTTVPVVIGTMVEDSLGITTNLVHLIQFQATAMSEDFQLLLNTTVLPTSKEMVDYLEDKYICVTNPLGAIDVLYYTTKVGAAYPYSVGDKLTLRYVKLEDPTALLAQCALFYDGTINSKTISSIFEPHETKANIKINAPIAHEVSSKVRGRDDYKKTLKTKIDNCASANALDLTPFTVLASYVKSNLSLLSAPDKNKITKELTEEVRPFGTHYLVLSDPVRLRVGLTTQLTLNTSVAEIGGATLILNDIRRILAPWEKNQGLQLDLYEIEYQIERLSYIKVARVFVSEVHREYPHKGDYWNPYTGYHGSGAVYSTSGLDPDPGTVPGTSSTSGPYVNPLLVINPSNGNFLPNSDLIESTWITNYYNAVSSEFEHSTPYGWVCNTQAYGEVVRRVYGERAWIQGSVKFSPDFSHDMWISPIPLAKGLPVDPTRAMSIEFDAARVYGNSPFMLIAEFLADSADGGTPTGVDPVRTTLFSTVLPYSESTYVVTIDSALAVSSALRFPTINHKMLRLYVVLASYSAGANRCTGLKVYDALRGRPLVDCSNLALNGNFVWSKNLSAYVQGWNSVSTIADTEIEAVIDSAGKHWVEGEGVTAARAFNCYIETQDVIALNPDKAMTFSVESQRLIGSGVSQLVLDWYRKSQDSKTVAMFSSTVLDFNPAEAKHKWVFYPGGSIGVPYTMPQDPRLVGVRPRLVLVKSKNVGRNRVANFAVNPDVKFWKEELTPSTSGSTSTSGTKPSLTSGTHYLGTNVKAMWNEYYVIEETVIFD